MKNNFDNCLYIGTIEDLQKVCLTGVQLNPNDFKLIEMPRYASYHIKQPKENKTYYYKIHGKEIAVAKMEKLEKRILTTFEVFVYENDEPIKTFDIEMKNPTTITIFINNEIVAELVNVNSANNGMQTLF